MSDLDSDGYPSDEALECISEWPHTDYPGLLKFAKSLWRWPDLWTDPKGDSKEIQVSTGGWSGNESIINSLRDNTLFWMTCWVQSRRGGHFIFELRTFKQPYSDAAPQADRADSGWRPIESAPQGTAILGYWPTNKVSYVCILTGSKAYLPYATEEDAEGNPVEWKLPALWMPLPADPQPDSQGEK